MVKHTKLFLLLALTFCPQMFASPAQDPIRLLYLTQGGDPWHDYAWQAAKFQETLPLWNDVTITSLGVDDKAGALRALKNPDFAASYDILVYNACFAFSTDYQAIFNIRRQAHDLGIPVILLHCAMHNFRSTSPSLGVVGDLLSAWDMWKWKDKDMLPQWSAFTGIDSLIHEPIATLTLRKAAEHPITAGLPDTISLARDELYIARTQGDDVVPLYYGQSAKESSQPVVWLRQEGRAEVVGITLGHDQHTWNDAFFWQVLSQSVSYLTSNRDSR